MKRFNVAKEQRKLNRKINLANNIKIRTIILSIFVLVGSIMLFTYSKYSTSVKLDIMHSKVANFMQDDYILNAYIDGDEGDFPGKNDGYYVDQVVCNKGATGTWDDDEWGIIITGADEEETECNVYFINNIHISKDIDYSGNYETYKIPMTGKYKIELWGAGNAGAYTSGEIIFEENQLLYFYVGGKGTECNPYTQCDGLGFNGGASGGYFTNSSYPRRYASAGGATDVRLVSGTWDNFNSLKSRIMIAAGSGGTYDGTGYGGGLSGYNGYGGYSPGLGATQTSGGIGYHNAMNGSFGGGGTGYINYPNAPSCNGATGGGGGYYGGGGGAGSGPNGCESQGGNLGGGGGGGSSFISGHNGCNAINYTTSTASQINHTNQSILTINNVSYEFTNTVMIDGKGCRWTNEVQSPCDGQTQPDGTTATGHEGNGYARITLVKRL